MEDRSSEGMLSAFERFRNAVNKSKQHYFKLNRD
jgi:hypothetical protein